MDSKAGSVDSHTAPTVAPYPHVAQDPLGTNPLWRYQCPKCPTSWGPEAAPTKCPQCGVGDVSMVCKHGTDAQVHCCHCHAGFQADTDHSCHPRRSRMDRISEAERVIFDAVREVEAIGFDVRLTDAVNLLHGARDSVADFIDGIVLRRSVEVREHVASSEAQS